MGVGVRRERERRCKGVEVVEREVRREVRVGEGGSWRFASCWRDEHQEKGQLEVTGN